MSADNWHPPDTSWISDRTARRLRRVMYAVVVFALVFWIVDRVFFDGMVVRLLWYVINGPGPPGGF